MKRPAFPHRYRPSLALLATVLTGCALDPLAVPTTSGTTMTGAGGSQKDGGPTGVCEPGAIVPCYSGPAGTKDVGVCHGGTQVCNADGTGYGTCEGEVTPVPEDCATPFDEDCDGHVDQPSAGCVCEPGIIVACYSGPAGTKDVGVCHGGTQACNADGTGYGTCEGEVTPVPEDCATPFDEDCDGQVNQPGAGCVCEPGSTLPCYSGPAGTQGIGACHGGLQTCEPTGKGYGSCEDEVTPVPESCLTPEDDDCDGQVNPACGLVCIAQAGGLSEDIALSFAGGQDGAAFVSGYFTAQAVFGSGEAHETVLSNGGTDADVFIARYDTDCSLAWAKRVGSAASDRGGPIAVAPDGGLVVAGLVGATATFGLGEPTESVLDAGMFLARYEADGSFTWVKGTSATGTLSGVVATSVVVRPDGDFLALGALSGTAVFGAGEATETMLSAPMNSYWVPKNMFIARYGANGSLVWAKDARSDQRMMDSGAALALAIDGGALVTGSFQDSTTFGPGEPGETTLLSDWGGPLNQPVRTQDVFVAKYNPDGLLAWAKRAGGPGDSFGPPYGEGGTGIVAAPDGGAFVTGSFASNWYYWQTYGVVLPATFGPGEPGETQLASTAYQAGTNMFVARYRPDGTLAWVRQSSLASVSSDRGLRIVATASGGCRVTGVSSGPTTTFGLGEPSATTLSGAGNYWAEYAGDGSLITARWIPAHWADAGNVSADGTTWVAGAFSKTQTFGLGDQAEATLMSSGSSDIYVARFAP